MAGESSSAGQPVAGRRSLLVRSLLLAQEADEADVLRAVSECAESMAQCRTVGILVDRTWQDVGCGGRGLSPDEVAAAGAVGGSGQLSVSGGESAWVYPIPAAHGQAGFLVVSCAREPAEDDRAVLQEAAEIAGLALASARERAGNRAVAAELRAAYLALQRSMEISERLARVTMRGEGQEGIATAIYDLTEHPAGVQDMFGNLIAWAGPGRPEPGYMSRRGNWRQILEQAMAGDDPVRDGDWLVTVAELTGTPVGVVVLADPARTAGEAEWVTLEHARTALAMEVARQQSLGESLARARTNLVLELVSGAEHEAALSRAQALGYDLGRPHRVVAVESSLPDADLEAFFQAVRRAAYALGVASLTAARRTDIIVLADAEVSWEQFHARVEAEPSGSPCSIGVGGRCQDVADFARSYRETQLALRIQKAVGKSEQVTVFDELGVYQVLATEADTSAMESFAQEWLGALLRYDSVHGAELVATLATFLDNGGSYASATAELSVHRSTLKYRLRRIREVSGHDLASPDTQFNLQVATRAWRTLQALRRT